MRIFYAAGPGDVIAAHKSWSDNRQHRDEVALTYSGQFADFCREAGAKAYVLSSHARRETMTDGPFTLRHVPKRSGSGIGYHLGQVRHGLNVCATALRFRASAVVVHSDTTYYFVLAPLKLFGVRVIPSLHNTLWPAGYPPAGALQRLLLKLNGLFFRRCADAVICISPECARQVRQIAGRPALPIHEMRAQFAPSYFASIPPPPLHSEEPFRITFAGRMERNKGAFDVLAMAHAVDQRRPGRVRWELCGDGSEIEALKAEADRLALGSVVTVRGWTSPLDMRAVFADSHAAIVPTRSSFPEGLAKTAAEAILAGRPLVTCSVVPALEVLRPACIEAEADNVDSYVTAVLRLVDDAPLYERLQAACGSLQAQFYDRRNGYAAALWRAMSPLAR